MLVNRLSSPGNSVYYFKKTELISLKQGRQASPPPPDEGCGFAERAGACPLGMATVSF